MDPQNWRDAWIPVSFFVSPTQANHNKTPAATPLCSRPVDRPYEPPSTLATVSPTNPENQRGQISEVRRRSPEKLKTNLSADYADYGDLTASDFALQAATGQGAGGAKTQKA
jgi:hypothetical protein